MEDYMLTTVDNPYNPFTQFDQWMSFDESKGYYTTSYLARIAKTSNELSDEDNSIAINDAINEIIFFDVLGIYRKVTKDDFYILEYEDLSKEQKESLDYINKELSKGL